MMSRLDSFAPMPFRAVLLLLIVLTSSLVMNVVGRIAPPFVARSVSTGRIEVVPYRDFGKPIALYVFRPTCSWCRKNRSNIAALAKQVKGRFGMLALSLSAQGVSESLPGLGIDVPTYQEAATELIRGLHLDATPQIVVISPDSKVIGSWIGAGSRQQVEIERFFHVRLPGLLQLPGVRRH
jgi:hypothetical protein